MNVYSFTHPETLIPYLILIAKEFYVHLIYIPLGSFTNNLKYKSSRPASWLVILNEKKIQKNESLPYLSICTSIHLNVLLFNLCFHFYINIVWLTVIVSTMQRKEEAPERQIARMRQYFGL